MIPNLTWMSLIKCYWTLKNARVTAFTVSRLLLRENQQSGQVREYPSPTQISVQKEDLHPGYFLSEPGLAWQAPLNNIKLKIDLSTDIDKMLIVEKGIRGEICHAVYWYAKANNKYMKNYDKSKESSYPNY